MPQVSGRNNRKARAQTGFQVQWQVRGSFTQSSSVTFNLCQEEPKVVTCLLPVSEGSTKPRACPQSCVFSPAADLHHPFVHLLTARPGGLPPQPPCRLPLLGTGRQPAAPGCLGLGSESSGAVHSRYEGITLISKTQGAKRKAEGCNRPPSLSDVTHPCLPVSFAFYRRKAWVTFSPLLWVRRNTGWRNSTGGQREGRKDQWQQSGDKAEGRPAKTKQEGSGATSVFKKVR